MGQYIVQMGYCDHQYESTLAEYMELLLDLKAIL